MGVNISELLGSAELLETSSISMEEGLKYSIQYHLVGAIAEYPATPDNLVSMCRNSLLNES